MARFRNFYRDLQLSTMAIGLLYKQPAFLYAGFSSSISFFRGLLRLSSVRTGVQRRQTSDPSKIVFARMKMVQCHTVVGSQASASSRHSLFDDESQWHNSRHKPGFLSCMNVYMYLRRIQVDNPSLLKTNTCATCARCLCLLGSRLAIGLVSQCEVKPRHRYVSTSCQVPV